MKKHFNACGFTLIELSIVLIVIGLIASGILVGADLITAAEFRATITQIDKFNTATNTFRGKYGFLPGDIPNPYASMFGFGAIAPRGAGTGQGDGDGTLTGQGDGHVIGVGETAVFWVDLSTAGLIDGTFTTASETVVPSSDITGVNIDKYLPLAKIGRGDYFYVWSSSENLGFMGGGSETNTGINMFGLAQVTNIACQTQGPACKLSNTLANLTVQEAYNIDKKVDDGYPASGRMVANLLGFGNPGSGDPTWVDPPVWTNMLYTPLPTTAMGTLPGGGSPSTWCMDNNNATGAWVYSMEISKGSGKNCALVVHFQ